MKLTELNPTFLKQTGDNSSMQIDDIKEADGVMFSCPVCFKANNGLAGTHSIICWQPHVPQTVSPTGGRWSFHGTSYDDLELRAGSSSILLTGGCNAHFFIRNGEIQF